MYYSLHDPPHNAFQILITIFGLLVLNKTKQNNLEFNGYDSPLVFGKLLTAVTP